MIQDTPSDTGRTIRGDEITPPTRRASGGDSVGARTPNLTAREISELSSDQLVDIVRKLRLPIVRDEILESIASYDRNSLEQLVLSTQRCRGI